MYFTKAAATATATTAAAAAVLVAAPTLKRYIRVRPLHSDAYINAIYWRAVLKFVVHCLCVATRASRFLCFTWRAHTHIHTDTFPKSPTTIATDNEMRKNENRGVARIRKYAFATSQQSSGNRSAFRTWIAFMWCVCHSRFACANFRSTIFLFGIESSFARLLPLLPALDCLKCRRLYTHARTRTHKSTIVSMRRSYAYDFSLTQR